MHRRRTTSWETKNSTPPADRPASLQALAARKSDIPVPRRRRGYYRPDFQAKQEKLRERELPLSGASRHYTDCRDRLFVSAGPSVLRSDPRTSGVGMKTGRGGTGWATTNRSGLTPLRRKAGSSYPPFRPAAEAEQPHRPRQARRTNGKTSGPRAAACEGAQQLGGGNSPSSHYRAR
jgi:hypothetical protein